MSGYVYLDQRRNTHRMLKVARRQIRGDQQFISNRDENRRGGRNVFFRRYFIGDDDGVIISCGISKIK